MPPFTVQIPEEYRYLFPQLLPHDVGASQVSIGASQENYVTATIAQQINLGNDLDPDTPEGIEAGLDYADSPAIRRAKLDAYRLKIVKRWPIKETAVPVGQSLGQTLEPRQHHKHSEFTPPQYNPTDPAFQPSIDAFQPGADSTFDVSTLFQSPKMTQTNPVAPVAPAFSEQMISNEIEEVKRQAQRELVEELKINPDRKGEINRALLTAKLATTGAEAVVMTANEMGAAQALGELTTWEEVAREYKGKELIKDPMQDNLEVINPAFLQALTFAGQQNGYLSAAQVATIKAEADKAMVTADIESKIAVAIQQGADAAAVETIRQDGAVNIANAQAAVDQARFEVEQNLATLNHNAKMAQGSQQHVETMAQLGLNREQQSDQYAIQNAQIEASVKENLRRYNLDEAESLRRYNLQLAIQAGQSEDAARNFAKEMEALKISQTNVDRQREQDRITAETNERIADIQANAQLDANTKNVLIAQENAAANEAIAAIQAKGALDVATQQGMVQTGITRMEADTAAAIAAGNVEAQLAGFESQEYGAEQAAAAQIAAAESGKLGVIGAAQAQAGGVTGAAQIQSDANEVVAQIQADAGQAIAEVQSDTMLSQIEKDFEIAEIQTAASEAIAVTTAEANKAIATTQAGATTQAATTQAGAATQAAATQAGAVTEAAALQAEAAGPFGYMGAGLDAADRAQRLTDAQSILGAQYNPYGLSNAQFTGMQDVAAQAGATQFGALSTAPDARYQDILGLQQAQAAQGPFQAAQLGQGMGDISTILRGGLTPEQQLALAQAPGNPFGFTANEAMALQNSLARGGLTPTQRLAEVQAGAAPQNMANYLNFIGNPAAVGFAGQSGFLQNVADSPEGNIPASLFGLNVPQNTPAVPTNPTMADLSGLTDEQLGFYQGQQAAQNYQTPSQIFQQAQMVTPQGV